MPKDFTLHTYSKLINSLRDADYAFLPFIDFISNGKGNEKIVVLRHDVDRLPQNALQMASLENSLGIRGTYYFRVVKESYDESIIRQIVGMGHEVGYHYENLSEINKKTNHDPQITQITRINKDERLIDLAYEDFCYNLEKMQKLTEIKTICMHGSPLSKWDNRMIWEKYSYKDLGIIGEPYFDVDYNDVFYISDTGRSWNNLSASVRDTVSSGFDINIKNTHHLIELIKNDQLPDKIMLNVHPQRWTDKSIPWLKELVMQRVKNVAKRLIVRRLHRFSQIRKTN